MVAGRAKGQEVGGVRVNGTPGGGGLLIWEVKPTGTVSPGVGKWFEVVQKW